MRADEMQDWATLAAIPCDRCGAVPNTRPLVVMGSPRGVLAFIEKDLGLVAPCRGQLLAGHVTLNMCFRVLLFCASCHPEPESNIAMELGYPARSGRWVPTGPVRPMPMSFFERKDTLTGSA
jgi:hypothetical protein